MGFNRYDRPGPVPLGLTETLAAGLYARYGHFQDGYVEWAKRFGNGVPRRVLELAERLREEKPWELAVDPEDDHPGMTRIHVGSHSFLVPTKELLP